MSPAESEICNNGKDDNCDGQEDEQGATAVPFYLTVTEMDTVM